LLIIKFGLLFFNLFFFISCQKASSVQREETPEASSLQQEETPERIPYYSKAKSYLCEGVSQYFFVCHSHVTDNDILKCAGDALINLSQRLNTTTLDGLPLDKMQSAAEKAQTCYSRYVTNLSTLKSEYEIKKNVNEIKQCTDNFMQTISITLNCNYADPV